MNAESQRRIADLEAKVRELERFAGRFPVRAPVGGSGGAGSSPFRLKSIQNDYLTCRTWDGTTDGSTDVYVAKPFLLRHALANYSTISSFTTVNSQQATVIAIADSVTYTWRVVLPYAVNDVIWAHRTTLGDVTVSSQPVIWEDDAKCRIWAVPE